MMNDEISPNRPESVCRQVKDLLYLYSCAELSPAEMSGFLALVFGMGSGAGIFLGGIVADYYGRKNVNLIPHAAQARRDEGRYTEARALTLTCASEACPAIVRRNCEKWRSEIETAMPPLVLVARRADGATEASASVLVDGVALLSRLTGTPVAVDPGERRFTFRLGDAVAEVKTLVAAGTKNQLVEARFAVGSTSPSQAAPAAAALEAPQSEPPSPRRGPPVASLALGTLGVAGVGAFAYFAATAKGDLNAIERAPCAATKTCPESETDSIRTRFLVGDTLPRTIRGTPMRWLRSRPMRYRRTRSAIRPA